MAPSGMPYLQTGFPDYDTTSVPTTCTRVYQSPMTLPLPVGTLCQSRTTLPLIDGGLYMRKRTYTCAFSALLSSGLYNSVVLLEML